MKMGLSALLFTSCWGIRLQSEPIHFPNDSLFAHTYPKLMPLWYYCKFSLGKFCLCRYSTMEKQTWECPQKGTSSQKGLNQARPVSPKFTN